jgi:hypothetical protein
VPALPLENVGARMNMLYTLRYTDKTGRLIRTAMIPCKDAQEAVQASALTMQNPYAALQISIGNKVVWSGSKERVNVWASAYEPDLASSVQPSPVLGMLAARAKVPPPATACLALNHESEAPLGEGALGTVLPFRF